jgi:hypothetical protein
MSTDAGTTWAQQRVLVADSVAFPEGGVFDGAGNAYFAWGDCKSSGCTGSIGGHYRLSKTLAGTTTTTFSKVANAPAGPECTHNVCGFAFFGIQNDVAIDAAGTLYMIWQDGQDHTKAGSPPIAQLSRSTDGGETWEYMGRADDKNSQGCNLSKCYALFPRIEAGAKGQIAVTWMDDRLGSPIDHNNGWNVWLRTSLNGGKSWTGPSQRISRYDPSRPESAPNGYKFPYGDYHGIMLDPDGTMALQIWGEGWNYAGTAKHPGHILFARTAIA